MGMPGDDRDDRSRRAWPLTKLDRKKSEMRTPPSKSAGALEPIDLSSESEDWAMAFNQFLTLYSYNI